MLNVLQNRLLQIVSWLRAGPLGQFFTWWTAELREAMPKSWQRRLLHALRRVTLTVGDESLEVGVDEYRRLAPLETFAPAQDAVLQKQQIEDLLVKNELQEAPRFLLLDVDSILRREMKLPLATESNLAQVLAFEMDRQTPFRASDVYYDWRILERGGESGQLHLELFVAPRAGVDRLLKELAGRGFTLAGVDIREGELTLGLNLLPADQRVRTVNSRARLNLALGGACALLLALVMAQSLYLRSHQISELEEAIAAVQGEARQVMQVKERIQDSSEAAGFLAKRRAETPLAIQILADITRILPNDTYLDRLVISRTNVQMQGKSQNAQQLIELVNGSPLLGEAAFRGSTRLDARSGLEIFEVNAQILGQVAD